MTTNDSVLWFFLIFVYSIKARETLCWKSKDTVGSTTVIPSGVFFVLKEIIRKIDNKGCRNKILCENAIKRKRLRIGKFAFFSLYFTTEWRPLQTFVVTILSDTCLCSLKQLESCMLDREVWCCFGSVYSILIQFCYFLSAISKTTRN